MANPTTTEQTNPRRSDQSKPTRLLYYVILGALMVAVLIAARIMGMPKGVGVEHEPEESSAPARP